MNHSIKLAWFLRETDVFFTLLIHKSFFPFVLSHPLVIKIAFGNLYRILGRDDFLLQLIAG